MNDKELLSIENFNVFINRFEFSSPLRGAMIRNNISPQKTMSEYLFDEIGVTKTPEDIRYLTKEDSLKIILNSKDIKPEDRQKWLKDFQAESDLFLKRHETGIKDYNKKYIEPLQQSQTAILIMDEWKAKDSVYLNVLKLSPGIIYDVIKVRSLDFLFKQGMQGQKEDAKKYLDGISTNIREPFLKEESKRIYNKNFPTEKVTAYELPNTPEAQMFKKIIAPLKGKILLVDLWATSCGPCLSSIKQHKSMREKYKDSKDVDFVFITSVAESPINAYNKLVEEQELTNTHRLTADEYRYLRQLFRFNGIPRYLIVDREGRILNDNASSYNFEDDLKKILEKEAQKILNPNS